MTNMNATAASANADYNDNNNTTKHALFLRALLAMYTQPLRGRGESRRS